MTGEVGLWSQWLGRGERRWEQPKLGAVQDKSPRMKDGENAERAPGVEKMREGEESAWPSLVVMSSPELRLELH